VAKRMTPQQRLDAYIEHCRQVHRFYEAGRQVRRLRGAGVKI
jgi:hypothetical protein